MSARSRSSFRTSRTERPTAHAALKVKKKFFVRLKEDGDSLVIGMPFEQREALMAEDPGTYYITDHYLNYEYVLVRLSKVSEEALRDLLKGAYRAVLPKKSR